MNKVLKAFLVPLIKVLQFIFVSFLISGLLIAEYYLWQQSWKFTLVLHTVVVYLIAVLWAYITDARW